MFPEGVGARRAFVGNERAAEMTNELLENAWTAIKELSRSSGSSVTMTRRPSPRRSRSGSATRWT
eukprot:3091043-Prymnesium_polylepis.1